MQTVEADGPTWKVVRAPKKTLEAQTLYVLPYVLLFINRKYEKHIIKMDN